jgi:carbonic anhydrase
MKKQLSGAVALIIAALCNIAWATTGQPPAWSYTAPTGPENWGELHSEYERCTSGKAQSPIDIETAVQTESGPLTFAYQPGHAVVLNNGHTIEVSPVNAGSITLASGNYSLVQLHFHTPSEEKIQGRTYPLNAHLVHRNAVGEFAVVALLFEEGAHNPTLERILANMPGNTGGVANLEGLSVSDLLPTRHEHYAYSGSLTTPPCTEGVRWHVLSTVMQLSPAQLQAFQALYPMNARPVQPLNGRQVHIGG